MSGEFEQTPDLQIKRSEIEAALKDQSDAMVRYNKASYAVRPDVRTELGQSRNNVKAFQEGQLLQEEVDAQRKRTQDLADARDALDKADEQLKKVSEKYADDDPSELPPSLL